MSTALAIERELAAVLAARNLSARRLGVVSPLGRAKGVRLAWRIDLADGATLKRRSSSIALTISIFSKS